MERATHRSSTVNFPDNSQFTTLSRPLPPPYPAGKTFSLPGRSSGRFNKSGWLTNLRSRPIALRGWESFPRSNRWTSFDVTNVLYNWVWSVDGRQKTTCSYLTGTTLSVSCYTIRNSPITSLFPGFDSQYLDNKSFVRRMMNLLTSPPSSFNLASLSAFSLSVASASRPRRIFSSKFFLKSPREPRYSGLAKLRRAKYSERSFWIGVPVRMTRR